MPTGWSCWNGGPGRARRGRLSELSGLSVANTSQHLQHLRRAGLVQTRRDGKRVLYRLGDGPIAALLAALGACAEHQHAEMREVIADSIHQRERLDGVSITELVGMLKAERDAAGRAPGRGIRARPLARRAQHPAEELERRLGDLPADAEIVACAAGLTACCPARR